ncbi:MAG: alpha/beta fold hydrolase [Solirubrobacteraceae bacterium]
MRRASHSDIRVDGGNVPPGGEEGEVRLAGGRRLAFVVHGDRSGLPVVLHHGTPMSSLGLGFADAAARARGVRLICPDRPGIGRSDPAPRQTLLGWADDVGALADAIRIERFSVIGYSGGGPHALACAARLPARVTAVALMAGQAPLDRPGAREGLEATDRWLTETSARRPHLAALVLRLLGAIARHAPRLLLRAMQGDVGDADRRAIGAFGPALILTFRDALRQGPAGVVDDYRRENDRWGFALADVKAPVDIWQGDDDRLIPMHHAEDLAARLPRGSLHRVHGEGHLSLAGRFDAVLDALLAHTPPDARSGAARA